MLQSQLLLLIFDVSVAIAIGADVDVDVVFTAAVDTVVAAVDDFDLAVWCCC